MTNLERIEKLIDAGYTKAEIDALMFDQTTPSQSGDNTGVDNNEPKSNETTPTEANTANTPTDVNTQSVNDQVSNVALLTAINNLTKTIQQNNRNNDTSDGNVTQSESASSILSKALK